MKIDAGASGKSTAAAQSAGGTAELRGQVLDENGQPVARVELVFAMDSGSSLTVFSDAAGRFEIGKISGLKVVMSVSKPGFFRITGREIELSAGSNEISVTVNHETEIKEQVDVQSSPVEIDPETTSHQESLVQHEILNAPVAATHDLQQSLRIIPQVVADSNGKLHVAGARQGQTEVLLDGFEINDPATGAFNSRVNVDAVRAVTIETGGYGAQYAHAGAGIISLDTQSGDDRVRFGITNFIPDFSLQQGTHFGNWYPRVTISGPIKKGKIWFSDALTIEHTFRLVQELPRGENTDSQWSGDNLIRMQANLSANNILQGSFLFNQLSDPALGLGPLTPLSTTTNNQSRRYFVSVKDQIWAGRTLFTLGAAVDTGHNNTNPLGTAPYAVQPSSASGNYFQTLAQKSRRVQLIGDMTTRPLERLGTHTISAGWNVAIVDFSQQAARSEIDYQRADGTLSDRARFSGNAAFDETNAQAGGYAQDLWRPVKEIALSAGVRADWDRLIHKTIFEPRVAMNWVPRGDGRTKFTLAWGEHYQPINLAILALGLDQSRSDTFYDATGLVALGPATVSTFVTPLGGLAEPRTYNATAEWDEKIQDQTFFGASFLLRESRDGFAWETVSSPSQVTLLLQNNRDDRYIAGEAWVRRAFGEKAQIELDYTRSRASSNEVLDPNLAQLILAPQQGGPLLWDAPNRFVSSGWAPVPFWGLLLSGFVEYRTGFPFSVVNEQQQLVGAPNRMRFPGYFSLNLGLEKRFKFRGHEWAARLTAVNATGHNNPDTVVNVEEAPNFLAMSGGQHRAFTVRVRLVTQK